jgi:hypothetical protein
MVLKGKISLIGPKKNWCVVKPNDIPSMNVLVYAKAFRATNNNIDNYKKGDEVELEVISYATRVLT